MAKIAAEDAMLKAVAKVMACDRRSAEPKEKKPAEDEPDEEAEESETAVDDFSLLGKSAERKKKLALELQKYQVEKDAIKIRVEKLVKTKFAEFTNDFKVKVTALDSLMSEKVKKINK